MITVRPTRCQMYQGHVTVVRRQVKQAVAVPGSSTAIRLVENSKTPARLARGVMIGRGAYGRPGLLLRARTG